MVLYKKLILKNIFIIIAQLNFLLPTIECNLFKGNDLTFLVHNKLNNRFIREISLNSTQDISNTTSDEISKSKQIEEINKSNNFNNTKHQNMNNTEIKNDNRELNKFNKTLESLQGNLISTIQNVSDRSNLLNLMHSSDLLKNINKDTLTNNIAMIGLNNNKQNIINNINNNMPLSQIPIHNVINLSKTLSDQNNLTKNIVENVDKIPLVNTSSIVWNANQTSGIFRNVNTGTITRLDPRKWINPNFNVTKWLMKVQAPWVHVSDKNNSKNETTVVQVCKFEDNYAICSAEYTSTGMFEKLWFQLKESKGRHGMDLSIFERGDLRVRFENRVNETICHRFTNGTFHQICVKTYGYDKDLGPTRVCIELGAAIFNHGVASSDYGCFRFGTFVRHEDPFDGESPKLALLNNYIIANNYSNFITVPTPTDSGSSLVRPLWSFFVIFITLIFMR